MTEEKNVLLDNPEEQSKGSSLETLLDSADVRDEQENELDAMFAQMQEHYQKNEYEQVLVIAEEAMKLDPSNGNLVLLIGLVNRDAGKKIQAVHWLRKALSDFGMVEAEVELMKLYQTGIAGAEYKAKAEAYFASKEENVSEGESEEEQQPITSGETDNKKAEKSVENAENITTQPQEKDICTYPAPGTPLYTVEEYREFLQKYSNLSEAERLEIAEKEGRGFGYHYMSIANAAVRVYDKQIWSDWNNLRVSAGRYETSGPSAADTCKTLNSVNDFVRQDVARTMQNYLENHNRTIDCWPVSETDSGFVADNIGDGTQVKLNFDYFARNFEPVAKGDKYIININRERVFKNGYSIKKPNKPQELTNLENKIKKLEKVPVYTEEQRRSSQRCFVASMLPLVLLLLNVLATYTLTTGKDLFGLGKALIAIADKVLGLWNAGIIGKIVAFIPILVEGVIGSVMLLVYTIAHIFNAETIAAVILVIASLIIGAVAYSWCMEKLGQKNGLIRRKDVQEGQEAHAEAEALRNGEEMKRLWKEYSDMCEKTKEVADELSRQWHTKWFEACERRDI